MENEPDRYATHGTSSRKTMIIKRGALLISAYRKDDFADPTNFAMQVAVVFEQYDDAVIIAVTDPRNSDALQCKHKFPPSIAEIREACDAERDRQHRMKQEPLPKFRRKTYTPNHKPGARANVRIHPECPRYAEVLAWTQSPEARRPHQPGLKFSQCSWKLDHTGLWIELEAWNTLTSRTAQMQKDETQLAAEARAKLITEFGQDAFDAVPNQPTSFRHLP